MNNEELSKIIYTDFKWASDINVGFTAQELSSLDNAMSFNSSNWLSEIEEDTFWRQVRNHAKTNEALQYALDRVKILYHLSVEDGNSKT